ncbi:hypothetical protein [Spongorhabdus nitratireducens]
MSLSSSQCILMWYTHRRQASSLWQGVCRSDFDKLKSTGREVVNKPVSTHSVECCVRPMIQMHYTQMAFWSELLEQRGWSFDINQDKWVPAKGLSGQAALAKKRVR